MQKKILIIEDQAPMRRNLALMLELEGYQVCVAENGRAGVEAARKSRPDLILCDVMMPEMDGYGVVQALREDDSFANTPFIFLTAKSERADVRMGMNFGADDYLTKPVVRDDLLAAVQTRLDRAEALQQRITDNQGFSPDFERPDLLQRAYGLTGREAEVLLWVAQGKSNSDVSAILEMSEKTVKQHLGSCFQKMGVESRSAAAVMALEALNTK
ncbi:MAG TPA: DNA-binding response regulator [Verrucomicrobiales bacterium]|nr:DNA-binding response regulator [Verrucomicrobiales bacterium]HCN76279.1 DNA-binding response regulator [Verrucomicrobiales bacterium]